MDINKREDGDRIVLALVGRLDTNTSPQLEECATDLFDSGSFNILVDMAECDFVSSAGLRVIVAMQKHVMGKGSLAFANVKPDIMDVFDMTGFSKLLTFE